MADIDWLLDQVARSKTGPGVAAFFDFDGTLIDGYSAGAFFKSRLKHGEVGIKELVASVNEAVNVERRGHSIDELMRMGVQAQAGERAADVNKWARTIFAKRIARHAVPEARELIEAHQDMGHTIVVASSATTPQIEATADDLGIPNIICTEVEIDEDGFMTGNLASPIRWGQGKAQGVLEFAEQWDIKLADSFSYSNGAEDIPFLETTGHPVALNPDKKLVKIAKDKGWPVAFLQRPPKTTPLDVLRTTAAMGALSGSVVGGSLLGLFKRNRQDGANFAAKIGGSTALTAAGVELNIVGEENAWNDRPAIFLFNHQSQLDVFVLAAVLERDFTGVAKKQLEKSPLFAPLGYLADVAYIDRANREKAIHQLEPVVQTLKDGRSIVISPEGTRSPTTRLLPFKKGPFHMAMQAGVPVVPFIMRNCGELMAAHSYVIHPGTVDVAILPAIYTDDWTPENMEENIEGVRQQFLDTLRDWPKSA